MDILVNGEGVSALIDTGSTLSFISSVFAKERCLKVHPTCGTVSMASTALSSKISGYCLVDIGLSGNVYKNFKLTVMEDLCRRVILGHDIMKQHESITIKFGGAKPCLIVCGVASATVPLPSLFTNLAPDIRPVTTKSRRFNSVDKKFIQDEISMLLADGVIEPSKSPWRSQVVITTEGRHKKRMCIDYSRTINRFTYLDAFPLPRIDDLAVDLSQFSYFSSFDLKSAYHQIPIKEEEKVYTAFEANGHLYQFCRIPFGLTNAVAGFQRIMDEIITNNSLNGTFAYLDNVMIGGMTQEEHDENVSNFLKLVKDYGLTLNEGKTISSVQSLNALGYTISQGSLKPDAERLLPLLNLPVPTDIVSLKRCMGMFSYYSHWIPRFSDKIKPLADVKIFPLSQPIIDSFQELKNDIKNSMIYIIDESKPLVVETDASDIAIAATLSQEGRPIAFFSRSLSNSERNHSSIEKEAQAIVESVRKWRHYLAGRHFTLITDQRSVSFMFDNKKKGKIKNDKILRWRMDLSCYSYNIVYRPGTENAAADTFSRAYCSTVYCPGKDVGNVNSSASTFPRVYCSTVNSETLRKLHISLCHPGVTRMSHFVRCKNYPFSIDDIKAISSSCRVCAELKPRFIKNTNFHLIKATQPFERLNIDFKGPLPSSTRNRYILTIVDEFSRFPFAFACPNIETSTVISCLSNLFSVFGMPSYLHSDRGTSFMSEELKQYLLIHGVASSRTTSYNPQGNGQCERYNGIIWKTVSLALKSKELPVQRWETVLTDALHSIRSLLCSSTNTTPHERMFNHLRRSTCGTSIPSWLLTPGKVLMKRHVRRSKFEPLVDEVDLLEATPQYAHVRLSSGKETTVSLRDLAPRGQEETTVPVETETDSFNENETIIPGGTTDEMVNEHVDDVGIPLEVSDVILEPVPVSTSRNLAVRRSGRTRKAPTRLDL